MWTRGALKDQAKFNLRGKYWMAFAVSLVVGLFGGGTNLFSWNFDVNDFQKIFGNKDRQFNFFEEFGSGYYYGGQDIDWTEMVDFIRDYFTSGLFLLTIMIGLFIFLIALAFQIFVTSPVQVGGNRWFSRSRESAATPVIGQIFSLFKSGSYLKTVGSMVWMRFFLFLWGLLASVPTILISIFLYLQLNIRDSFLDILDNLGQAERLYDAILTLFERILPFFALISLASIIFSIPLYIKTYSYRMTPWILADNPQIGYRRALKLSMALTSGHKLKIWVLDLSFIGWFILGSLLCGIGVLFVMPYYNAVQAELYAVLRQNAVTDGSCTMEDFGYIKVEPSAQPCPEPTSY